MSSHESSHPFVVSPCWLRARLGRRDLRVADVSVVATPPPSQGLPWGAGPAREAYEAGHVPGAAFVDLLAELSDPEAPFPYTAPRGGQVDAVLERLGVHEDTHVVLYDGQAGSFACRAWLVLRHFGLDRVSVLDGGFSAWTASGGPVTREEPAFAPGTLRARRRAGVLCGKDEVVGALERGGVQLVNALARRQWDGTETSSFTRHGQIPGSVEAIAASLVDLVDGRFVSSEAARSVFDAAGVELERPVVVYCGGGVSAAKSALVLAQLGARDVRVYDGSLSEWTADLDLPLELPE